MDINEASELVSKEIKEPIRLLHSRTLAGSVPALIFWGIDTLANISRPKDKDENTQSDFKNWFAKYIKLQDPQGALTPDDWYSARCAVLHTSTPYSKDTRTMKSKKIVYAYEGDTKSIHHRKKAAVSFSTKVDSHMVVVSIDCLIEAFFEGIDEFIVDVFADPEFESVFKARLRKIFVAKKL